LALVRHLVNRRPEVAPERLVADLVPPPRFADVRFATYVPDPAEPTQTAAVAEAESFGHRLNAAANAKRSWFRRAAPPPGRAGIYFDGGFGVGKTHLLASLWHTAPAPKAYGTFVEITHLVGALGFANAVEALAAHRLLCVDEFELDDPGDTVLVASLLTRLADRGVRLAATSNTLPDRLGEGRFAAEDFLREIQGLSTRFETVRVDGPDYRHRGGPVAPTPLPAEAVRASARQWPDGTVDGWDELLTHLARLHPSRYGALLDGVTAVHLLGVAPVPDQNTALRLVVLADRLYDRAIPVIASGVPFDQVFDADMLAGGYRKKYLRAVSRLVSLARDGTDLVRPG
jgi:cell division protein ZapE